MGEQGPRWNNVSRSDQPPPGAADFWSQDQENRPPWREGCYVCEEQYCHSDLHRGNPGPMRPPLVLSSSPTKKHLGGTTKSVPCRAGVFLLSQLWTYRLLFLVPHEPTHPCTTDTTRQPLSSSQDDLPRGPVPVTNQVKLAAGPEAG